MMLFRTRKAIWNLEADSVSMNQSFQDEHDPMARLNHLGSEYRASGRSGAVLGRKNGPVKCTHAQNVTRKHFCQYAKTVLALMRNLTNSAYLRLLNHRREKLKLDPIQIHFVKD